MTLVVPTVEDVRTQQALNVIAQQFPLRGQQYANESVEGKHIVSETITGNLIVNGTITGTKIAAGTIEAGLLAAESVETKHLKAEAVTAAKIKAETIEAGQIKANAITAAKINAEAVEAGKIKAEAVTTTKLAANAVTAAKIEAHTITATQIAASTITSTEIASATITGSNIASATVTASNISVTKLSALSADLGTITAGTVTGATLRTASEGNRVVIDSAGLHAYKGASTAVLDFSIETGNLKLKGKVEEGSEIPAATITGQLTNAQIKELEAAKLTGTISESQIGSEVVGSGKIKAEAVTAGKIATDAVEAAKIKAGAVETAKLAASAVTAEKIAAETITAGKIASNAIEGKHIKAEAVESSDIKAETILASNIAASTITGGKLAAGTITATQLSATAIDAMTITGALFRSASTNPKVAFDSSGFYVTDSEGNKVVTLTTEGFTITRPVENPTSLRQLEFTDNSGNVMGTIFENVESKVNQLNIRSLSTGENEDAVTTLRTVGKERPNNGARLFLESKKSTTSSTVKVDVEGKNATILSSAEQSGFLQLGEARKERDRGLVTALPESAVKGDRCFFIADETNGVVWALVFSGSTYWNKVGGPPLTAEVQTDESTSSAPFTDLATKGPTVKLPLAGDYDIEVEFSGYAESGTAAAQAMAYAIGGTAASFEDSAETTRESATAGYTVKAKRRKTGLSSGAEVVSKYQVSVATGHFRKRRLTVNPVRVK